MRPLSRRVARVGRRTPWRRFLVALAVFSTVIGVLALLDDSLLHWFVIPVILCGALIGPDAYDMVAGRRDLLDPVGVVGVFGVHFFVLAPLLHVHYDSYMRAVNAPGDWRPWLGIAAMVNAVGIVVYLLSRRVVESRVLMARPKRQWRLNKIVLFVMTTLFAIVALVAHFYVLTRMGGLTGYVRLFEEGSDTFAGTGSWLFFSERFPMLVLLMAVVWLAARRGVRGLPLLTILMVCFFALTFVFSGLRGSRANVVWAMAWGVGLLHMFLRRLTRKTAIVGIVLLVGYSYVYAFYKTGGLGVMAGVLRGEISLAEAQDAHGRDMLTLALGDFGRSDVQALTIYRFLSGDIELAYGRSYIGDVVAIIPSSIMPVKPPNKTYFGTLMQYGVPERPGGGTSTRIYGMVGEAILNFGMVGAVFPFAILGVMVAFVGKLRDLLPATDPRMLMYPFLVTLCILFLVSDLDNFVVYMVTRGAIPATILVLSSRRGTVRSSQ